MLSASCSNGDGAVAAPGADATGPASQEVVAEAGVTAGDRLADGEVREGDEVLPASDGSEDEAATEPRVAVGETSTDEAATGSRVAAADGAIAEGTATVAVAAVTDLEAGLDAAADGVEGEDDAGHTPTVAGDADKVAADGVVADGGMEDPDGAAGDDPEAADDGAPVADSVTGTVTYRERISLTPGARLTVQLLDVSLMDLAAELIAEQVISSPGQVPINFEVPYNLGDIESRHTYSVSARIHESDGRLLFINDTAHNVITRGHPETVDMVLMMVSVPSGTTEDMATDDESAPSGKAEQGTEKADPSGSGATEPDARTGDTAESNSSGAGEESLNGYVRRLPVSPEARLRTFVVGDSQAFHLGLSLQTGEAGKVLDVTRESRHSTGLSRPDYYDWPDRLSKIVDEGDPELIVIYLGSNDWQDMPAPARGTLSRGSQEWIDEWSRRLGEALDVLQAPHRRVIWVGLPPTRSSRTRQGYALMNQIAAEVTAERGLVTWIDIWDVFGGDDPYREAVPPPGDPGGTPVKVRHPDGIHLNRAGSGWVAEIVSDVIERLIDDIDEPQAVRCLAFCWP